MDTQDSNDTKEARSLHGLVGDTAPQAPDSEAAGVAAGEKCPNCDDAGWYPWQVANRYTGEAEWEQVQCEWCYTIPNSRFNRSRLAVAAVSPTSTDQPT